ncbi:MAG: hypothetical protein R2880_18065 [Deinococcales bacterium]
MIEDSVENFITKWKTYAVKVEIFPMVEGSPLVECGLLGKVLHLFERTGPYESHLTLIQHKKYCDIIIHAMLENLKLSDEPSKSFRVTGLSKLWANGLILLRFDPFLVLDVGFPLVIASFDALPDDVAAGDWLEINSLSPLHGFIVPPARGMYYEGSGEI